jgi:GNAT superfamily N-acetyltransferase
MLSIRPAEPGDVGVLRTMIHEMAEYERLPVVITEERLAQDGFGARPEFRALLAEWDGQPAGYDFIFNCYSTFRGRGIFLEDLYVRAQFRGKRIGDILLARVAALAAAENCFGIMINVLEWNHPAIGFFRSHDFKFLDDWKTGCLDGEPLRAVAKDQR